MPDYFYHFFFFRLARSKNDHFTIAFLALHSIKSVSTEPRYCYHVTDYKRYYICGVVCYPDARGVIIYVGRMILRRFCNSLLYSDKIIGTRVPTLVRLNSVLRLQISAQDKSRAHRWLYNSIVPEDRFPGEKNIMTIERN